MQYQLLETQGKVNEKGGDENVRLKIDNIRLRTLETDILMLRQELAEANSQKSAAETQLEKLRHSIMHLKENNITELERKYANEIRELKHMIYMLTKTKDYAKNLSTDENPKKKGKIETRPMSKKAPAVHEKLDEFQSKISELEKENENLHHDNYRLAQEIQYLEFKLKAICEFITYPK